jgi:hypothetical protein
MVDGYIRLREVVESNHAEWEPGVDPGDATKAGFFYATGNMATDEEIFYEGNVYALKENHAQGGTGTVAPVHTEGIRSDGRWDWEYKHSGRGYAKITAVTDAYRATADVVKNIPASCVSGDIAITSIADTDDIRVTSATHGYVTGDQVFIRGVSGDVASTVNNQVFTITVINATTFDLDGTTASGTGTGGVAVRVVKKEEAVRPVEYISADLWAIGAWSTERGYPRTVAFFEDRLWWAGSTSDPQSLWASKTSEYEDHEVTDEDDSAILITLNTDQVNVIEWISPSEQLIVGTAGGEFTLGAASSQDALTPGNVRSVPRSTYGVKSDTPPVRIDQVLMFVQRAGRKLREFVFDDATQAYTAPDLTILAEHIALGRFKKIAFQQEPNRILWCILHDGSLIGFTYERAQEVVGWHRHPVGGTDATVESIAVIPHPDGDQDMLWAIISRTIDGGTKQYIEYLEEEWLETNDLEDAFFVDSGLTYDGAAETNITGLDHLEGETVKVLADGEVVDDETVSSGAITIASASVVQVGLGYDALLETMRLEAGAGEGTAQGRTKRIDNVIMRLWQTGKGLFFGPSETSLTDEVPDLTSGSLFDGDTEIQPWPGGYEKEARMVLKHSTPLPFMLTALFPQLKTSKR